MNPCTNSCPHGDCANCVSFGSPQTVLPACMGGFCSVRASCSRYHAENRDYPAERLCAPGTQDCWEPIRTQPITTAGASA